MEKRTIAIGLLTIVLALSYIMIAMPNSGVKLRIDEDKSTFYIQHLDETGTPYGRYLVSGREYNRLFDGSSIMKRSSKDITIQYLYENNGEWSTFTGLEEVPNATIKIVRTTPYIRGPVIEDIYIFDTTNSDVELFPVSHTINIYNASGYYYRYTVDELKDTGSKRKLIDETELLFGYRMKVTLQEDYRWAWIGYPYGSDSLSAQYNIDSDFETYEIRLFDPIDTFISSWNTSLISTGSSNTTQIKLPLEESGTYNFIVYWGDGNNDTITVWNQSEVTHDYASAGEYDINITGTIIGWVFNNGGDKYKILDISNWGVLNVGNSGNYFDDCENLNITATDDLNLTGTTDLSYMFYDNNVNNVDCSNWDVSNVTYMYRMFFDADVFNRDLNSWNVSSVTSFIRMFYSANIFNGDVSSWNLASVSTNGIDGMFANALEFNQDISDWNISRLTSLNGVLSGTIDFNQNLTKWDVSSITNFDALFQTANSFTYDITNWNVSSATIMNNMFGYSNFNQDITNWDVSNVQKFEYMFRGSTAFNQEIGVWNTSSATSMYRMFYINDVFNKSINAWDVSSVTDMEDMFAYSDTFNQPLNNWDVSSVTTMKEMFEANTAFNQDISDWNISNVNDMTEMFNANTGFSDSNYDLLLENWADLTVQNGVVFDADPLHYTTTAALAGRNILTDTYNWIITDSGSIPNTSTALVLPTTPSINDNLIGYCAGNTITNNTYGFYYEWYKNDVLNTSGFYATTTTTCFQEQANESTVCGGLATGTYDWLINPLDTAKLAIDGNLTSLGSDMLGTVLYINYSIPTGTTNNSVWHTKGYMGSEFNKNITIPITCLNQNTLKLSINNTFHIDGDLYYDLIYECYDDNNAVWVSLDSLSTTSSEYMIYEENMYWKFSDYTEDTNVNVNNISNTSTATNDEWKISCAITTTQNSTWLNSTAVTIHNDAPTMNTADIDPTVIAVDGTFDGYCNGSDAETDIKYNYIWYRNGVLNNSGLTAVATASSVRVKIGNITTPDTSVGGKWILSCSAFDGEQNSSWLNSSEAIVNINAPVIQTSQLKIDIDSVCIEQIIDNGYLEGWCNATDVDENDIYYEFISYKNGVVFESDNSSYYTEGINSNINNISSDNVSIGDNWTFSCRGCDIVGCSNWLNSTTIEIHNLTFNIDNIDVSTLSSPITKELGSVILNATTETGETVYIDHSATDFGVNYSSGTPSTQFDAEISKFHKRTTADGDSSFTFNYSGPQNQSFNVLGHQNDEFNNLSFNVTGGLYNGTFPSGVKVYVDGELSNTIDMLSNTTSFTETEFNDSTTAKNTTLLKEELTIVGYIQIPKTANITSANLDVSGYNGEGLYTGDHWDTSSYIDAGCSPRGLDNNGTHLFVDCDGNTNDQWYVVITDLDGVYVSNATDNLTEDMSTSGLHDGVAIDSDYIYMKDSTNYMYKFNRTSKAYDSKWALQAGNLNPTGQKIVGSYIYINSKSSSEQAIYNYSLAGVYQSKVTLSVNVSGGSKGLASDGTYFWTKSNDNFNVNKYNMAGTYISSWVDANTIGRGGITQDGTYFYTGDTTAKEIYKYLKAGYSSELYLEVGFIDGDYEWNYTADLNESVSPITTDDFTTKLNLYLTSCTADANGFCDVPLYLYGTPGIVEISNIEINYTYNPNPIYLDRTLVQSVLTAGTDYTNITITIEDDSNGSITVDAIDYDYLGGESPSYTIKAHTGDGVCYIENELVYTYSGWDYELPNNIDYINWYPPSPTAQDVQPFGQTDTIPILNVTTVNYGSNMDFSIKMSSDAADCVNMTVWSTNNKTAGTQLVNDTYITLMSNMSDNTNFGIWLWADLDCSYSDWRIWEPTFSFLGEATT